MSDQSKNAPTLKVTRSIRIGDVWVWRGRKARIMDVHTCRETGVSRVEIKTAISDGLYYSEGYQEVSTFMRDCQMRLGRFVTTERKFLGIRLPPKVAFVAES